MLIEKLKKYKVGDNNVKQIKEIDNSISFFRYEHLNDDNEKTCKKKSKYINLPHFLKDLLQLINTSNGKCGPVLLVLIYAFILVTFVFIVFILASLTCSIFFYFFSFFFNNEYISSDQTCVGRAQQSQICSDMNKNKISGNLCIDLCVSDAIRLPRCPTEDLLIASQSYQFYLINDIDSSFICSTNKRLLSTNISIDENYADIEQGLTMLEFRSKLSNYLKSKINESSMVEKMLDRLLYFADVNKDEKINYAEASTLWSQIHLKHFFYMQLWANKAYVPIIKDFCGNLLETEQIKNQITSNQHYNFFYNPFKINKKSENDAQIMSFNSAQTWAHRCKTSIGVLEFFIDSVSFNPNDEFGPSSLYLCSPIEYSFGYNFYNEAKLIYYDQLLTGIELEEKLKDRYCKSDLDCSYTKQCTTKCDLSKNKCTSLLNRPQLVDYCMFINNYLMDNKNVTGVLGPLIKKCLELKSFYLNEKLLFEKNEMPLDFKKHDTYIQVSNYWKSSLDYTTFTNELITTLWNWIKFELDPVKKKQKKAN